MRILLTANVMDYFTGAGRLPLQGLPYTPRYLLRPLIRHWFRSVWFAGFVHRPSLDTTTWYFSRWPTSLRENGHLLAQFSVAVPGEVPHSLVLWLCSPVFSGIHNPVIYLVAAILLGRRPISGAVSACSLRLGFRSVWFSGLFPGYSGTYNPGVSTGGRHPYGETANSRRGFQLQSPADVLQCPILRLFSLAFPRTHNPVFRLEAATPTGRWPIPGTGFRLQSLVLFRRVWFSSFHGTHNPAFRPKAATPPGRRPTIGTAFQVLTRPFPDLAIPPAMPRAKRPRNI